MRNGNATEPTRVNAGDLAEMDWGYQQTLWQEKPFTGVAYEERPDGSLISEADYDDGFQRTSREWYPNGHPREDKRFGPYGLEGMAHEWHSNGQLKSETSYEHGLALSKREWDAQGGVIGDWHLTEDDPAYARLQERRRAQAVPSEAA